MSRLLISLGLSLVLMGVLWQFGSRWGLGQLPGDLSFKKGEATFYFPFMSCLVLSIVLSFLFWLFGKFRS